MTDSRSDNSEEALAGDGSGDSSSVEKLSPEKLSEAFAEMLSSGPDSAVAPVEALGGSDELEDAASPDRGAFGEADDAFESGLPAGEAADASPRGILEAMLFVGHPGNEPLTAHQAAGLMRGVTPLEIDELVRELNAGYVANGCPYHIISQDAGYRMVLRDEFSGLRDRFYGRLRQARLSPAAIEVLATVAYNQPLTRDQVNEYRRVGSGSILAQLVRRQLLRMERRAEKPRAPYYYTTQRFLELFELESLDDLPRRQELDKR